MLTNKTIGGREIVSEYDYLFRARIRQGTVYQAIAEEIEVNLETKELIDHKNNNWKI